MKPLASRAGATLFAVVTLVVTVVAPGGAVAAFAPFPPDDSIRAWAQERVDGHHTRGMIVGLLEGGARDT